MSRTTRGIIGFDRWGSYYTFAAGGGSWDPDYPVSRLSGMPLYRAAQTTSGAHADTKFVATSSTAFPVGLMAFIGHNADQEDDVYQITGYHDLGGTQQAFQTGWEEFWPIVYTHSSLPFEHESFWTGKWSARERARKRLPIRPVLLDSAFPVKRIEVAVKRADPDVGPFRCRLFDICLGHQVSINPDLGMQYGFAFRTRSVQAYGGHKEFGRLPKAPTWSGVFSYMLRDEAMQRMYDMLDDYDLVDPFLFFPFPDETMHWLRTVHFVRNNDPGSFARVIATHDQVPFAFEGVL